MRALTFHGPGRVEYETSADPTIEAAGDVVVAVRLTAVCGSDLHVYRGNETGLDVGTVLGHEFEMRLCEAAFPGVRERGWHHATLTAFVSPIVAARMLDLDWEKMQHAIGISGSRMCTLGVRTLQRVLLLVGTDTDAEETCSETELERFRLLCPFPLRES